MVFLYILRQSTYVSHDLPTRYVLALRYLWGSPLNAGGYLCRRGDIIVVIALYVDDLQGATNDKTTWITIQPTSAVDSVLKIF